jgi:hypothetical protein
MHRLHFQKSIHSSEEDETLDKLLQLIGLPLFRALRPIYPHEQVSTVVLFILT